MKRMLLTTNGHFLPYLSAAIPKMMDPTDLSISTNVIPQVISVFETLNCVAKSPTVKETVKKSNASHDWCVSAQIRKSWKMVTYPCNETNEEESPLASV
jgi:hypothetical protein